MSELRYTHADIQGSKALGITSIASKIYNDYFRAICEGVQAPKREFQDKAALRRLSPPG